MEQLLLEMQAILTKFFGVFCLELLLCTSLWFDGSPFPKPFELKRYASVLTEHLLQEICFVVLIS